MDKYLEFEEKIKYTFKNKKLLKTALTHKSYAYEQEKPTVNDYNERLEFLGDAILEHIISDRLYRVEPCFNEGTMSKKRASIVCEKSLSEAMRKINISKYMNIGKCEIATNGRDKDAIIADMFEAVLGAIYLDSDYETAKKHCERMLDSTIEDVIAGRGSLVDYKTKLQEKLQVNGNIKIEYKVVKETGPDHNKHYYIELLVEDKLLSRGEGKNKKEAQQNAAKNALEEIK